MAKKYRAFETKIHWLTWVVMAAIVLSISVLLIALQPSSKDVFYDSYFVKATEQDFQNKLPKSNNFVLVNRLEDGFLGISKGLYSKTNKEDQLSIIYFGSPELENGSSHIANVYARLYGSTKVEPQIPASNLINELENQVTLYYFENNVTEFTKTLEKLNEHYTDTNIVANTLPFVLVVLNGEVVDYAVLTEANIPLQLMNFYQRVFENEKVSNLIQ
ncbi:hypothetical protein [Acholeplasma granularum]|uniref:hypothetical protein n=1 Tax=Acholeplasma granularum TaxID=264635 RepID=UPI000471FB24|nr:hypothetical protein [Acholeplasma granularum]